jgi:hypothetical protein
MTNPLIPNLSEPILNPGDLVRLIEPQLPPPWKVVKWMGLRPGMEGVVLDGPHPCIQSAACLTRYLIYIAGKSAYVISICLEKIDGPPPEEEYTPDLNADPLATIAPGEFYGL